MVSKLFKCKLCLSPCAPSPPAPPTSCAPSPLPCPPLVPLSPCLAHLLPPPLVQDARKQNELRVKLQMAQFLQDTIEEMALKSASKKKGDSVREFAEFFEQVHI